MPTVTTEHPQEIPLLYQNGIEQGAASVVKESVPTDATLVFAADGKEKAKKRVRKTIQLKDGRARTAAPALNKSTAIASREVMQPPFSQGILDTGFKGALALSFVTLLGALSFVTLLGALSFLFVYLIATQTMASSAINAFLSNTSEVTAPNWAVNSLLIMAQIGLRGCGVLVGLACVFIGLAMFLIGAKSEMSASVESKNSVKASASRMSPGIVAMLCATVIIYVSITHSIAVSGSTKSNMNNDGLNSVGSPYRSVADQIEALHPQPEKAERLGEKPTTDAVQDRGK